MMRDELILFETAKLAKEKGFSLNCFGQDYYVSKTKLCKSGKLLDKDLTYVYSAPTQSLLQRWLREKHFINICVGGSSRTTYTLMIEYLDIDGTTGAGVPKFWKYYKTYEKVLEVGLLEALQLIK